MDFRRKLYEIESDLHLIDERECGNKTLKNIKEIDDRLSSIVDLINFKMNGQEDLKKYITVFEEFEYKYKKILRTN